MIGKTIGNRYEITAFLGRGGMAWVYRATDRKTGDQVALKILYPQFADDSSYIQRFIREAKLAMTLDHPNIVRVLDYGAERDTLYLVMEYIEGQDLKALLCARGGPLSPREVLGVARQVASALHQAHLQGIVHRDIKPQNLMQTTDGQMKVLDFGIARAEEFATITGSGFVGSPYYVAPEQAMSQSVDIRSDIYSLGVSLYELLIAHLPFDAETPWSIISQHISHVPLPVSDIRADVPLAVADLVSKMLAKKPEDRFQTPKDLIAEIDKLLAKMGDALPVLRTGQGHRFEVKKNKVILGRNDPKRNWSPDIDLSDEPRGKTVHRKHALLYQQGEEWLLKPNKTNWNPTSINGQRLPEGNDRVLHDGDRVALGGVDLVFEVSS